MSLLNPCLFILMNPFSYYQEEFINQKSQTVLLDQVFGKLQLSILYLYLNIIIKGSFGHKTKSYPSLQVHIITW